MNTLSREGNESLAVWIKNKNLLVFENMWTKSCCNEADRSVLLKENTIWEGILCGLFRGTRTNIILYREAIRRLFFSENILIVRIKNVIESITQQFSLETLREGGPKTSCDNTIIRIEAIKGLHSNGQVIFCWSFNYISSKKSVTTNSAEEQCMRNTIRGFVDTKTYGYI